MKAKHVIGTIALVCATGVGAAWAQAPHQFIAAGVLGAPPPDGAKLQSQIDELKKEVLTLKKLSDEQKEKIANLESRAQLVAEAHAKLTGVFNTHSHRLSGLDVKMVRTVICTPRQGATPDCHFDESYAGLARVVVHDTPNIGTTVPAVLAVVPAGLTGPPRAP